ncbi:hypothetical protein OY671_011986, partial [Metschnikowia pulcherrima]
RCRRGRRRRWPGRTGSCGSERPRAGAAGAAGRQGAASALGAGHRRARFSRPGGEGRV